MSKHEPDRAKKTAGPGKPWVCGPSTLDGLVHQYAVAFWNRMFDEDREAIDATLQQTWSLASFYSGWEPTSVAARLVQQAAGHSDDAVDFSTPVIWTQCLKLSSRHTRAAQGLATSSVTSQKE